MTKADSCKFCRVYAVLVVALSTLAGAASAAQLGFGLRNLGGFEHVMRVVALSSVRSFGPGVTGSALLVALIVAVHPLAVPALQVELPKLLKRAALVTLPGYLIAVSLSLVAGLLVAVLALGQPWSSWRVGLHSLGADDLGAGLLSTLVDTALLLFLARRFLARFQDRPMSLPAKLVLAWTFGTGLRLSASVLVSMLSG